MPSDLARFLAEAGRAAPSADNSQPFDFSWDGEAFAVAYSQARNTASLFAADAHPTLLALGACLENIDTALAAVGRQGRWQFDETAMGAGSPYARLFPDAGETAALPARLPIHSRHTNRFPYARAALATDLIGRISRLRSGAARLVVFGAGEHKSALAAHVRVAAEARFSTPEIHQWMVKSLRFAAPPGAVGDGLDVRTLHLPPGGTLFLRFISDWRRMRWLNLFGAFKALARVETLLLDAAPNLVCIVAPGAPASSIDAGRLISRVWTDLNAQGIAVHPYYVVTDQLLRLRAGAVPAAMTGRISALDAALPQLLGTDPGESLQMILRIGRPRVDPPRSQRLPLEAVYQDLTGGAGRR